MDVQPEAVLEQRRRDQHAVRRDDHDGAVPGNDVEPLRLLDRDAEPLGRLLRRRRADLAAAAARPVGPRQQELDLVRAPRALRARRRRTARSPRRRAARLPEARAAAGARRAPPCAPRRSCGRGSGRRPDGRSRAGSRAPRAPRPRSRAPRPPASAPRRSRPSGARRRRDRRRRRATGSPPRRSRPRRSSTRSGFTSAYRPSSSVW